MTATRELTLTLKPSCAHEIQALSAEQAAQLWGEWVDLPASRGASLAEELPTLARCEDHLRDVRDAGAAIGAPALVDEWERRLLVAAHAVAGSGARAAALLGMNARTFNAKMEKWGSASDGHRDGPPHRARRTPGAR